MAESPTNSRDNAQLPKQSDELRQLAFRVHTRFQAMERQREENGDSKWDTWDRLSRNIPADAPPEDWMANVFVPYVQSTELAIISEIADQRPRWRVIPQTQEDEKQAETIEAITDFTMEKGHFDDEMFKFIYDKIHYGTGVWKEFYRQDRRRIKQMKKDKLGRLKDPREWEEKDIREFDDVYGKHIPLRNFYLDDKAMDIREARDCVERNIFNIEDFKERYKRYRKRGMESGKVKEWGFVRPINEKIVKDLPPGGDLTHDTDYLSISELDKDDEVEVLEYWNKMKDEHVVVANGIVIVNEPIPYDHKQLPYAMDVSVPIHNSAWGMGIPQILEAPQEEINTLHNMMIDESKLSIHKPMLMGGMTLMDEDEYQLRPKGIIPVDEVTNVRELEFSGVAANNFQMFEELKNTIVTASGLDVRFAQAAQPKGSETATEVLRLQESSLRRIRLYQKMLMNRALPRIATQRTQNIQQFYKDPLRVEQITDDAGNIQVDETTGKAKLQKEFRTIRVQESNSESFKFITIKPEDIRAKVDIKVIPQSLEPMSDAIMIKRMNTILQTVLSFPPATQMVDIQELLRQMFKRLDLPNSIIRSVITGPETSDVGLANEENIAMANGDKLPPTQNPSPKHTAIHAAFIYQIDENGRPTGGQTEQFESLPSSAKEIILDHYEGELQQQAAKGNVSAEGQGRTVNRQQGVGVQDILGGQVGTTTANQGI